MSLVHPGLIRLAAEMDFREDQVTDSAGRRWPVERCPDCSGTCAREDGARLGHLLMEHGWRADGKRYDNSNRVIEEIPWP